MKVIYIAGPYSNGDAAMNVRHAIDSADKLADMGWCTYIPHLTHFWHIISPHSWEFWLKIDLEILRRCDAVYMLKGWKQSKGAREEYKLARQLRLEILYEDPKENL